MIFSAAECSQSQKNAHFCPRIKGIVPKERRMRKTCITSLENTGICLESFLDESTESEGKDYTRGERRRRDIAHALRKRAKDRSRQSNTSRHDWYDNLHEYSKGKIHCSCPMCKIRTNDKKCMTSEPPIRDKRKLQALEEERKAL